VRGGILLVGMGVSINRPCTTPRVFVSIGRTLKYEIDECRFEKVLHPC
jgi:hypothetical protein